MSVVEFHINRVEVTLSDVIVPAMRRTPPCKIGGPAHRTSNYYCFTPLTVVVVCPLIVVVITCVAIPWAAASAAAKP